MKKFYKMFLVCTLIFSFMLFPSISQCQWGPGYGGYYNYGQPQYPWYGTPYGQPTYGIYGQPQYNQPYYGTPYGYGNQPYNYGGYYQPQPYGYGGWGQPYNYGGYNTYNGPYRYATNYNQPPLGGYYTPYSPIGGYSYSNYYGSSTLPSKYTDADVKIDYSDDGDDITVDKGDTISFYLPSTPVPGYSVTGGYEWSLDTDELDEDIVDKKDDTYSNGAQYWLFEAEGTGTTTIKIDNISWLGSSIGDDTFEVEITVVD